MKLTDLTLKLGSLIVDEMYCDKETWAWWLEHLTESFHDDDTIEDDLKTYMSKTFILLLDDQLFSIDQMRKILDLLESIDKDASVNLHIDQ